MLRYLARSSSLIVALGLAQTAGCGSSDDPNDSTDATSESGETNAPETGSESGDAGDGDGDAADGDSGDGDGDAGDGDGDAGDGDGDADGWNVEFDEVLVSLDASETGAVVALVELPEVMDFDIPFGGLRVFDTEGVSTLELDLAISPEALCVTEGGTIFVLGDRFEQGGLLRELLSLDARGQTNFQIMVDSKANRLQCDDTLAGGVVVQANTSPLIRELVTFDANGSQVDSIELSSPFSGTASLRDTFVLSDGRYLGLAQDEIPDTFDDSQHMVLFDAAGQVVEDEELGLLRAFRIVSNGSQAAVAGDFTVNEERRLQLNISANNGLAPLTSNQDTPVESSINMIEAIELTPSGVLLRVFESSDAVFNLASLSADGALEITELFTPESTSSAEVPRQLALVGETTLIVGGGSGAGPSWLRAFEL